MVILEFSHKCWPNLANKVSFLVYSSLSSRVLMVQWKTSNEQILIENLLLQMVALVTSCCFVLYKIYYRPQTKFARLCFYTCLSFCPWEVCMVGGMHVWQGGVHGKGACVARGCVWQGCVHGTGVMHGRGACVVGGHVWQGGMHGGGHACHGRYYRIWSMSRRYTSYWNAFLFTSNIISLWNTMDKYRSRGWWLKSHWSKLFWFLKKNLGSNISKQIHLNGQYLDINIKKTSFQLIFAHWRFIIGVFHWIPIRGFFNLTIEGSSKN